MHVGRDDGQAAARWGWDVSDLEADDVIEKIFADPGLADRINERIAAVDELTAPVIVDAYMSGTLDVEAIVDAATAAGMSATGAAELAEGLAGLFAGNDDGRHDDR
jgi:hypothetical protein